MSDVLRKNKPDILRDLAISDLKLNKLKATLTTIIILLSTCLMGITFSILFNDAFTRANQAPYHAIYRATDEQIRKTLSEDPDFSLIGNLKNFGSMGDSRSGGSLSG